MKKIEPKYLSSWLLLFAGIFLSCQGKQQPAYSQAFFRDSLDMGELYQTKYWNKAIETWVSSYTTTDSTIPAVMTLIDRTEAESPEMLQPLVHSICRTLEERGDIEAATAVAAYPYGIDPEHSPEIARRLLVSILLPGKKAPPLEGLQQEENKTTLLFFYESRCRSCMQMISELTGQYTKLKDKQIRIVTISVDKEKKIFEEVASAFPWPDTLCDYQGFHGKNAISYGVAGTPAIYLIDSKEIVKGKYDTLLEIFEELDIES
ncbi:thiol-disulfide isomerase/thioredoxin [Parabacteroides sp. PF5-5]|uniref:peroxiredoxin family protein n=1 Tax=unclassified Parabacteroides TaxID=2649774 RepID=UPI00247650CC|nr:MULTISPECIES: thioredoxin family protein [unclassified Parabacteroides]MDH6307063.1 thiol-disulfide isomerase/thioredoxin [Parabacteroides sp. PH5-39]MDH6317277.1 thiol-disulfide isomerase/thioredoxin [Parabacteroides sp. PF5-13]MDH6321719.1 thiol-disulfide isomerase/thioredoxin [Parabacteroides sp. PH5-13]MDH6325451.1 thiol-disulfide isomerase/thioredoxin [Parabacteroides sp. PH5-8]MDH6328549.1 thiol-disulfide isomerase/thioredoxin [Parabacteroides sp. PH5-41]